MIRLISTIAVLLIIFILVIAYKQDADCAAKGGQRIRTATSGYICAEVKEIK